MNGRRLTRWRPTTAAARAIPGITSVVVCVSACAIGPQYVPPAVSVPPAFKEVAAWKPAQPNDQALRGKWWEIFGDPQLNALEEQLSVSNNTVRAAQAQFDQARALVRGARAATLPAVGAVASGARTSQSENRSSPSANPDFTTYLLRFDAAYEADVWGRIRQTIRATRASAQAGAADLESVNLSLHAELAVDYFLLRALDAEKEIFDSSVAAYERALELTRSRYQGGVASGVDVAQAEAQLESTRTQAIDNQLTRAQLEHAIAVLLGRPASSFSVPAVPLDVAVPAVGPGLPAELLERRPDIAGAERRLAAASAEIGIAATAFYPVLALTGTTGVESAALGRWLRLASNFWSIAPAAAVAVFDGGRRRAVSEQARAEYAMTEALYRETVLVAFREVEDNLAALRSLEEEATTQAAAITAADRVLTLATNRYRGGVTTYLEVVIAQSALLNSQRAGMSILARRLTETVLLIKALGGGWEISRQNAVHGQTTRPLAVNWP